MTRNTAHNTQDAAALVNAALTDPAPTTAQIEEAIAAMMAAPLDGPFGPPLDETPLYEVPGPAPLSARVVAINGQAYDEYRQAEEQAALDAPKARRPRKAKTTTTTADPAPAPAPAPEETPGPMAVNWTEAPESPKEETPAPAPQEQAPETPKKETRPVKSARNRLEHAAARLQDAQLLYNAALAELEAALARLD